MVRSTAMKRAFRLARLGPDFLLDELTDALRLNAWQEFNGLFLVVYGKLRERKAATAGQEMLRLRMYEKLQQMVQLGVVEKTGKQYRGITTKLNSWAEHLAAEHCRQLMKVVKPVAVEGHVGG